MVWRCGAGAPSYPVLALDAAGRLARELAAVAAYVEDLRETLRGDARSPLLVTTLARVIVTAQQLRQHALHAVTARWEESIEIHERALRARMNIILRGLYALKQSEQSIPAGAFAARFRSLREVTVYLVEQLTQIHMRWQEQLELDRRLDSGSSRALAYAALDEAEVALARLGRDPDLERFFRVGATSANEAVTTACGEIAATLGHELSSESATTIEAPSGRNVS